jgi:putative oxidoreductase
MLFPPDAARSARSSAGLLVLRLVAGAGLIAHGWGKIKNPFGWQTGETAAHPVFQFLAAISELGGGLALIAGLLVPLASLGIMATMLVAVATHVGRGDPFTGKGSFELALVYAAVGALFLAVGPGRFSLDWLLSRTSHRRPGT